MRIGVLLAADSAELKSAHRLGFRSLEWMRFEASPAATEHGDWKSFATQFAAEAHALGLRISAIGALYRNPLDPKQTDFARRIFHRAIEVASAIGVRNVSGFPGAVIEPTVNDRGGNAIYHVSEGHLPQLLQFWEPIADFARDRGVRIAFEHCPQGSYHLPMMHYNAFGQPAMWERFFDASRCENIGLEWDASHLICQFIDPVANLRKFGSRVFHVHAKDARIHRALLAQYGLCHPGVAEHRFPGFGDADWAEIIHTLVRIGYDSDLNIEGWHDPVFRNHSSDEKSPCAGQHLEETGLRIAKATLQRFVPPEP
jgi:sugar phosphate isomerase/epimerase